MDLGTALGLTAGVLVVSALAAGLVERAPLSFPMLFPGLGFLIGDRGLGLVSIYRVLPDLVAEWAADRLRDHPYVLYYT